MLAEPLSDYQDAQMQKRLVRLPVTAGKRPGPLFLENIRRAMSHKQYILRART